MKEVTCNYGKTCFISTEEKDGQKLLKIDFNITSYKYCLQGWHEKSFPHNIVINDKLYLNEAMVEKLVLALDHFVKYGEIKISEQQKTDRGFAYGEFKDINDNVVHLQKSSAAMYDAMWFGCRTSDKILVNDNGHLKPYEFKETDHVVSDTLHMKQDKAQELKEAIVAQWSLDLPMNNNRFKL